MKSRDIFSFASLHDSYKSCLKGKVNKASSMKFEVNREKNLIKMSMELTSGTYEPGPFSCFAVADPKLREVWAADFKDRIIHHLIVSRLEPLWEKIFINDSYACRKEKGAHRAIAKIKKILANNPKLSYLHADIRGFFTSIDKKTLLEIVFKRIRHPKLVQLIRMVILQDPTENYIIKGDPKILRDVPRHKSLFGVPKGKGLPIGNYTSQFFANVYLNELDQYAKRTVKCKHYIRYMDDIIIFDKDEKCLCSTEKKIDSFLKGKLSLELHRQKTIIKPTHSGMNTLGYVVRPGYSLSRRRVVGNIKNKLREINCRLREPQGVDRKTANIKLGQCVINSYWGHFKHADCAKLKENLHRKHFGELNRYLEKSRNGEHFIIKDGASPSDETPSD